MLDVATERHVFGLIRWLPRDTVERGLEGFWSCVHAATSESPLRCILLPKEDWGTEASEFLSRVAYGLEEAWSMWSVFVEVGVGEGEALPQGRYMRFGCLDQGGCDENAFPALQDVMNSAQLKRELWDALR